MIKCNDIQVGGTHYRTISGEQHWDRVWRLYGRGYFVGNITKYLERYHEKNGVEDLHKAKHYLEKLIELEYGIGIAKYPADNMGDHEAELKGYVNQDR